MSVDKNIQVEFAQKVRSIIREDESVIALAAAGSFITSEIDEFSDIDLILVTKEKISDKKEEMVSMASRFGKLVSSFTGDHVGEPRLLICLYEDPLIHVDIKFLTLEECHTRVENPVILFERDHQLSAIIKNTDPQWPIPTFQWIEDRFWTWIHYIAGKIGRGEYFECLDALGFLRVTVLSPLMQIKEGREPRGMRKAEKKLKAADLEI